MQYLLLWNEDSDRACGYKGDFQTKEDFIKQVKKEFKSFEGRDCVVKDVKIEACIETEKGLPPEMLMPLAVTDIEISNYYTATVIELD